MNTDRDLVLELSKSGSLPAPLASNPLALELGGEILQLGTESGHAMLAFDPPARFAQGGGVLQGGIVTALLDFAMAFAAHAKLLGEDRGFATASMSVQFLRPAPPARYIAHGRIVRAGRKLLFAEAQLVAAGAPGAAGAAASATREDASGRNLIATASAVLALAER
jgi:uncharacterized protein (TIGR00369 family)